MQRYVVNGLDKVHIDYVPAAMAGLGFNCVRMPFSLEQFYSNPIVKSEYLAANPQLQGLTAMEIFDKTIESLTKHGIMVILNNHISDAMWCCGADDGNGLWYNKHFTAEQWVGALEALTRRYMANPAVIGNDLRNEIRRDSQNDLTPTWGTGDHTDWKKAAEEAGNRILSINPDLLVIIEGLSYANDLTAIKTYPIHLNVPNKLVYSAHAYSWELSDYSSYE